MNEKRPRGRPPVGDAKLTERIYLRSHPRDKARFQQAARKAGVSLAVWMHDRLRRAAERELE